MTPLKLRGDHFSDPEDTDQPELEDFFGKSVILAARIASQAQGGQILVSSLLKALVESSGEFEFGDGREVELKGLVGSHVVFTVVRQGGAV